MRRRKCRLELLLTLAWTLLPVYASSQTPFYEGKTITVIAGTNPGGTADMRTRAVVSVLRKHIPGNPTIVIEYTPGGGGQKAANLVYRARRPDGLTIGAMPAGFVPAGVLDATGVLYDIDKLIYLGTPESGLPYVLITRKEAGLNSVEKLRGATGVRVGAQSVGHPIYNAGRIFAYVMGLKEAKFITGYSGPELDLALIRGEVDARANIPDTVLQRNRDWIEKGLVDFHAFIEVRKGQKHLHPAFAQLHDVTAFARSDRERKLVEMFRTFRNTGAPFVLPPGTPKDRAQVLQEAMRKTFEDPEFHKEFKKLVAIEPTPLTPEELENLIRDLPREPEVIELFKKVTGGDPLPAR